MEESGYERLTTQKYAISMVMIVHGGLVIAMIQVGLQIVTVCYRNITSTLSQFSM